MFIAIIYAYQNYFSDKNIHLNKQGIFSPVHIFMVRYEVKLKNVFPLYSFLLQFIIMTIIGYIFW